MEEIRQIGVFRRTSPKHITGKIRSARGGAIVEISIVLPLFMICLVGTLELGRALSQLSWMSQATYEAVRAGVR